MIIRFRCRIGWHAWNQWEEVALTRFIDSRKCLGMKRNCFYCGLVQYREIHKK